MAQNLSLDKVKAIPDKWRYCVFGYVRKAQALWNTDNPYYQIPEIIQFIILLFYYHRIESVILNESECDELLSLFENEGKFKNLGHFTYNLIWRMSKDGLDEKEFKEKCHDKPNLLCLIQTSKKYVIGGYTSRGWPKTKKREEYFQDDDAFLLCAGNKNAKEKLSMRLFNANKGHNALRVQDHFVLIFGQDCSIWIRADSKEGALYSTGDDYENIPSEYWISQ